MKKALLGATALTAMVALPVTAQASDKIKLELGGYYRALFAIGDQDYDDGLRDYGIGRESEVYFSGKTTLDNGIKVGAMIQLEGETASDQIDNSYIWTSGGFGRLELGSAWGPSLLMSTGSVGTIDAHTDFATHSHYKAYNGVTVNTYGGDAGISQNPDDKITYFTPKLSGFQVGASFMPKNHGGGKDESGNALVAEDGSNGNDLIDIAINYDGSFSGTDVRAYGSYFTSETENVLGANLDGGNGYSAGAQVSFANLTIGGRYVQVNDYNISAEALSNVLATIDAPNPTLDAFLEVYGLEDVSIYKSDKTGWRAGATFSEGPFTVGAAYVVTVLEGTGYELETNIKTVNGKYDVGPGIMMFSGVEMVTQEGTIDGLGSAEADATIFIIGTKLSF